MTPLHVASADPGATGSISSARMDRWRRRLPILWPVLVALVASLFCMATALPDLASADLMMSSIMATQKLTFFFWDQNRLASLMPALTVVIRDPYDNLYTQAFFNGSAFFGILVVTQRVTFGEDDDERNSFLLPVAFACAVGTFLAVTRSMVPYTFSFEQPYGTSLFLYLVGAVIMFRRSSWFLRLPGLLFVVASLLMNPTSAFFGALVLALALARGRRRSLPLFVVANVVGAAVSIKASTSFGPQDMSELYTTFEREGATGKWRTVMSHVWVTFHHRAVVVVIILCVLAIVLNWAHLSRAAKVLLVLLPPFAACWLGLFGLNAWVRTNELNYRYFFPVYLLVFVVILIGSTSTFELLLRLMPRIDALFFPASVVAIVLGLGATVVLWKPIDEYHKIASVRRQVELAKGEDIRFVGGNYFVSWPAMFALEQTGRPAFGFAQRGRVMSEEINAEVDSLLAQAEPIKLICFDTDPATCTTTFKWATYREWVLVDVLNTDPLVITVATPSI